MDIPAGQLAKVRRARVRPAIDIATAGPATPRMGRAAFLFLLLLATPRLMPQPPQHHAAGAPAKESQTLSPQLQQADALRQQGQFEQAREKVQEELQHDPASLEAWNMLGFIYIGEKDASHAVEAFQHALKLAPNSARTRNNLANTYLAAQKPDLAEKELRTILRSDPANADANYNLGLVLISKGAAGEAIPHFERIRPATVAVRLNLARAYLASNHTAEGLRLANELSAQDKDSVPLHFTLGGMLAAEKQYKAAEVELEKADVLRPGTFEILYNLGQTYLSAGDNSRAEVVLDRALKLNPDSVDALYLQAQAYSNDARPLDALNLLVRAHKIAPENTDVIYLLARVSMSQNYFEDAIPLLESGLALAPQRQDLLASLGESYFMAGKVDKAVEVFQKLIELDPSAKSYTYLGITYRHLGRFDEARQYFEKGLALEPHNSACLFNLGYIAERQGEAAKAEQYFEQALQYNPAMASALLELANLRTVGKKYAEAAELLRRYVKVSQNPATGYYKLSMVERNLHQTEAADRDLKVFQTMSKDAPTGPYPYEHLFEYLDNRARLEPQAQNQMDITQLQDEISKHPDQPQDLYLLAEAYLKSGDLAKAKDTIAALDRLSAGDFRTQNGVGVLLARYHQYDGAIEHFHNALQANPTSDEVMFNLADAYFRKGQYGPALEAAGQISEQGRKDDAYLTLLADIYAHQGDGAHAAQLYRDAIQRNPDNDQDYLSLALLQLRQNDVAGAKQTLTQGQARIPGSGKLLWGQGLASALDGNTPEAGRHFERAVDLLPEWPGSYSTLGVFYYETGQIDKAKEVLERFRNSNQHGALDINRIEQALAAAPAVTPAASQPMSMGNREQLLHFALSLADRTL